MQYLMVPCFHEQRILFNINTIPLLRNHSREKRLKDYPLCLLYTHKTLEFSRNRENEKKKIIGIFLNFLDSFFDFCISFYSSSNAGFIGLVF